MGTRQGCSLHFKDALTPLGGNVSLHSDKGGGAEENTYIYFHLLPVGVFDSRIVAFYPNILNELGGQAAFAHSPLSKRQPQQ